MFCLQGEHEHRRVKARYRLTSKNGATAQIVERDAYENEMRFKAQQLREQGVDIPFAPSEPRMSSTTATLNRDDKINDRYFIAKDQKGKVDISEMLYCNRNDPALQVSTMKRY